MRTGGGGGRGGAWRGVSTFLEGTTTGCTGCGQGVGKEGARSLLCVLFGSFGSCSFVLVAFIFYSSFFSLKKVLREKEEGSRRLQGKRRQGERGLNIKRTNGLCIGLCISMNTGVVGFMCVLCRECVGGLILSGPPASPLA